MKAESIKCPTCHSNTTEHIYKCKRKDCAWRNSSKYVNDGEKVHTLAEDVVASQKKGKKS